MNNKKTVTVVGAGLAGCEAAWQLAKQGISVRLYEMKPEKKSPAHTSNLFAELVCSNSLRSDRIQNAVGLLKEELRRLGSLIMEAADNCRVPAGGALAVDREQFSGYVTEKIKSHPFIVVISEEVTKVPESPCIIATGPLTSDALSESISAMPEVATLNFYDAAAPIVYKDSIDMDHAFRASRYDRGDDYLNCSMDEETYHRFIDEIIQAKCADIHGFEDKAVFEGCMPIESLAKRGCMTPAFGPLKPVGMVDPKTGRMPFAVLQLRQDDAGDTMYNLVGFQTRLTFPEQKRVFGIIPALKNAQYARYGVMHRNTFLHSPGLLDSNYQMEKRPGVYFAGQMTGVEGYVESTASGFVAGYSLAAQMKGEELPAFPTNTAIGALGRYVSTANSQFQPMNITFGLIDAPKERIRNKQQRYSHIAAKSLAWVDAFAAGKQINEEEQP
jgi:methylenetetrahydrofolate--tRNA-(uracil-5-)-methyltransferase